MTTSKKYKKDNLTATVLIIVFAISLVIIIALPYLANVKNVVDSSFLSPELFILLGPDEQADTYLKSYENAQLLGEAIKKFYLAFALQFFLLLLMGIWTKVLLRRYGRAQSAKLSSGEASAPPAQAAGTEAADTPTTEPRTHTANHYNGNG